MVKNRAGMTIIELIISATLLGGITLSLGYFLNQGSKNFFKLSKDVENSSNLALISGHLQKHMATGDVRFFGFTNRVDDPLARFLIPQPGLCGDLVSSCPEDNSLLYLHYDKSTLPAVSAICLLSTQLESDGIRSATFVVDGSNATYGNLDLNDTAKGFNVVPVAGSNLPSGLVAIGLNKMLAFLDPPNATIWVSLGSPVKLGPTDLFNSGTTNFKPEFSSCISLLQPEPASVPPYKIDKLYTVKVKPYGMHQFTGENQTAISEAVIKSSIGKFPLRLFSALPRSFGRYASAGSSTGFAEIRNCSYLNDSISCNGSGLPRVDNINRLRIDLSFHLSLTNATNTGLGTSRPLRYELLLYDDNKKMTMAPSESCQPNNCAFLPLINRAAIPYRIDLGSGLKEDFTTFSDLGYSWVKNISLSQLRFRLKSEKKEDYFDITFR